MISPKTRKIAKIVVIITLLALFAGVFAPLVGQYF